MRLALLCAIAGAVCALAPMSALAQTAPRFHGSSGASMTYAPPVDHGSYTPLWVFYDYPRGIPKNKYDANTPGYRYYPYAPYRTSAPRDHYNRYKSQWYPVR